MKVESPNYSSMGLILILTTYTIIIVFIGIKTSVKIWDRRTRESDGVTNNVVEINDVELKSLISISKIIFIKGK